MRDTYRAYPGAIEAMRATEREVERVAARVRAWHRVARLAVFVGVGLGMLGSMAFVDFEGPAAHHGRKPTSVEPARTIRRALARASAIVERPRSVASIAP